MQRREMLKWAGAASLAGMLSTPWGQAGTLCAEQTALPDRPSKMRLSLAAYSFNRFLPSNRSNAKVKQATMTLLDFIDYCAEQELDGCELTGYYFPLPVTAEYIAEIKQRTFLQGLEITGTAIGNDFCHRTGAERDSQLKLTRDWVDYAAAMGAPVIRIFAGKQQKEQTFEEAVELCAAGINESVEYAATKGVCLALENHGGITATPEQMLQIIDQVKPSPFFGVNFDSGNFRTADPYADLEKIAPLAINAQIKVEMFPDGKREQADLKRIVDILKAARYRGYVVLEYEAQEDPKVAIPGYLDQLRELIA